MLITEPGDRPPQPAVGDEQRGARRQRLREEPGERGAEAAPLETEVRHARARQAILVRVVHVVQRHLGVGVEQQLGRADAGGHATAWIVRIHVRLRDGEQEGLWEERRAERGGQVRQPPVRRADDRHGVGPARVVHHHPPRHRLRADGVQLRGGTASLPRPSRYTCSRTGAGSASTSGSTRSTSGTSGHGTAPNAGRSLPCRAVAAARRTAVASRAGRCWRPPAGWWARQDQAVGRQGTALSPPRVGREPSS